MQLSTFEEERREALESVLQAMAAEGPDAARSAACDYLLRHLTRARSTPLQLGPQDRSRRVVSTHAVHAPTGRR